MMTAIIALGLGLVLVIFIYLIEKKFVAIRDKDFKDFADNIDNLSRMQNLIILEIHALKGEIAEPLVQSLTNDIVDLSNQMGYLFEKLENIENHLQSYKDSGKKISQVSSGNKKTRTPEQKARMSQLAKERWLRRKQPNLLTMQVGELPVQSS